MVTDSMKNKFMTDKKLNSDRYGENNMKDMYERILLDLLKIVEMEGIGEGNGKLARVKAIHHWMDTNLVKVTNSQSIIKNNFTAAEEDALKYHMASKMAEELMEDAIAIDVQKNKVVTQVVAFRRVAK